MEKEIIDGCIYLKGVLQKFDKIERPYLTEEEIKCFDRKVKRALRQKKLERILSKNSF